MAINILRQLNGLMSLILGCPINLLLIWLILFRSKKLLQIWSRVLLQTTVLDLFAILIPCFMQIGTTIEGDVKKYFLLGPFSESSRSIGIALFYLQFFITDLAKYSLMVLFFYRWLVIYRDKKVTFCQYILLLSIPMCMVLANMSIVYWCFNTDGLVPTECSSCATNITIIYAMPKNSTLIPLINLESAIFEGSTYVVVILTNLLIWLKARSTNSSSETQNKREVCRQVGLVLLLQAIIPMIFFAFPSVTVIIFNALGLARPEWLSIAYSQNWIWVVYPLISILVIKDYRRTLSSMLKCKTHNTTPINSNKILIVTAHTH